MGINPSSRLGDNLPVEGVSWHEAQLFCKKLQELGIPAVLPTEAQWEYACRSKTNGPFSDSPAPNKQGWMAPPELATIWRKNAEEEGDAAVVRWIAQHVGDETIGIQPIGNLAGNDFGLFDMHGNVLEWCRDAWDGKTPYPPGPITDPENTEGGLSIARGGCWFYPPERCRSASREGLPADAALNYVGFRFIIPK
jgi:formylglycine-generating enzyme required for sulfatase activity